MIATASGHRQSVLSRIALLAEQEQRGWFGLVFSAKAPSAVAVVAAIAGRTVSSPQSGVAATVQRLCHG
jgi:hypothetical protein